MPGMSPLVSGVASDGDSWATSTSLGVEFYLIFSLPPLLTARLVRTRLVRTLPISLSAKIPLGILGIIKALNNKK